MKEETQPKATVQGQMASLLQKWERARTEYIVEAFSSQEATKHDGFRNMVLIVVQQAFDAGFRAAVGFLGETPSVHNAPDSSSASS